MKVIVAMSGGVDSSVAAALLVERGHDVVGVTLNVEPREAEEANRDRIDACCSLTSVEDARRVADGLGIPHYALNFKDVFRERVIDDFVGEYGRGRTPNPCIRCNEHVKFEAVLHRLHAMDADVVATGHYARRGQHSGTRRWQLLRGVDARKDQSYVLYPLTQELLGRSIFPLGELTKEQVRSIARERGLLTADKPESQEICFVADGNYGGFVASRLGSAVRAGPIVDGDGRVRGEHRGIIYYTVGQRRGLNLQSSEPLYVTAIDADRNEVVVGPESDLYAPGFEMSRANWVSVAAPLEPIRCQAKVRSRAPAVPCFLEPSGRVMFESRQKAVTPGQAAVLYDGELVLCGGTIDRVVREEAGSPERRLPALSSLS